MTNYDRIKSMSVEEMAELLVTLHYAMECRHYNLNAREVYKNLIEEEKQKTDKWEEESKPLWKQWLLQEVSENEMPDMRK